MLMKYLSLIFLTLFACHCIAIESTCYGTTSNGRLKHGVKLPDSGPNFVSYSRLASIAGRTYVHSKVKDIILASYKALEAEQPGKVFKYAETGFKEGGQFKPHKTHRNGLSVDFMVSVINEHGESVHLPTNPFNKFGYNIEFNKHSKYKQYEIDYEAVAAHIVELHKQSKKSAYDLWRVIFAPELQKHLLNTQYGAYLKKHIQFSKKRSWVRHDEHYHVDFLIPCEK